LSLVRTLGAWLLALLAVTACRREAEAGPRGADGIYAVELEAIEGPGAGSRSKAGEWVRREITEALRRSELFVPAEDRPQQAGLSTRVNYAEIRTREGRVLRLQIDVERPDALASVLAELEATVELERDDGEVDLPEDIPVALDRALGVLEAKVRLARDGHEAARRLLEDEDPVLVLLALGWVATHEQRENADAVAALLRHRDERVEWAAIETLAKIGSSDHVRQLVASARLADRAHTGRLYEALAELGGEEAEGFLDFAARNEDDPALAEVAQKALEQVQESGPGVTAAVTDPPRPAAIRGHR
jgi:hypothetical protein